MSGVILFSSGDLLEYTRPVRGLPDLDSPITVRAVVLGMAVKRDSHTGNVETRVWCYEGAQQLGTWEESETDEGRQVTTMEGRIDKERSLAIWSVSDLIEFDNFRVVRRGNSPTALDNFEATP